MRIREMLRARNVFAMMRFVHLTPIINGLIGCTELYSGLSGLGFI